MIENIKEFESNLNQFTGTENYYKTNILFPKFVVTDGVKYVFDTAQCYWLGDAIFSHQTNKKVRDEEFQIWELKVENSKAILTCKADTNSPILVMQEIEYTDFPDSNFLKFYFIGGVILLPSEY